MLKKLSILFVLALLLTGMSLTAGEKEEKEAVKKAEHVSLKGNWSALAAI